MASINHDFGLPAFSIGQRLSSATRSSITSTQARSGFYDLRVSQGALPLEGCQFFSLGQPPLEIRQLLIKSLIKAACWIKAGIFPYFTQIEPRINYRVILVDPIS